MIWLGSLAAIGLGAAMAVPQLLGAREKARNATTDNIYVALNGEVANELDGALNGGTGALGAPPVSAPATASRAPSGVAAAVFPPPLPQRPPSRAIVYSGEMKLTALDVRHAAARVVRITEAHGGYVAAQTLAGGSQAPPSAALSLRVPTVAFQTVTEDIARLGLVAHQTARALDQTEDRTDVDARLVAKRALEARLLGLVQREPASLADTLAVEKELARVRGEIEELAGRGASLSSSVHFAAIEVQIDEATGAARGFRGRLALRAIELRAALVRLSELLGRVAADVVLLLAPMLVVLLLGFALVRRQRRRVRSAPSHGVEVPR